MLSEENYTDILMSLYKEQVEQARHHEVMRGEATNYIIVASTALIGLASADKIFDSSWTPCARVSAFLLVIVLNVYGAMLSYKHYEKNRLHVAIANRYRSEVSDRLASAGFMPPNQLRASGRCESEKKHHHLQWVSLHVLWIALHVIFALIAVVLAALLWTEAV